MLPRRLLNGTEVKLIEALQDPARARAGGGYRLYAPTWRAASRRCTWRRSWQRAQGGRAGPPGRGRDRAVFDDLLGNLERAGRRRTPTRSWSVVEWADIDPRLGLRSLGGWRADDVADIVASAAAAPRAAGGAPAAVSAATPWCAACRRCRCRRSSRPPCSESGPHELPRCAASWPGSHRRSPASPRIRLVSAQSLDELSPPVRPARRQAELATGFPYTLPTRPPSRSCSRAWSATPAPKKGLITDLDDTLWDGLLGEVGREAVSWSLETTPRRTVSISSCSARSRQRGCLDRRGEQERAATSWRRPSRARTCCSPGRRSSRSRSAGARSPRPSGGSSSVWNVAAGRRWCSSTTARWSWRRSQAAFPDDRVHRVSQDGPGRALERARAPARARSASARSRRRIGCDSRASGARRRCGTRSPSTRPGYSDEFLALDGRVAVARHPRQTPDARALELVNKTNQFNLNGRRLDRGRVPPRSSSDPDAFLVTAGYQDRFGPLGKIASMLGTQRRVDAGRDRLGHELSRVLAPDRVPLPRVSLRRVCGRERSPSSTKPTARNGVLREFLASIDGEPRSAGHARGRSGRRSGAGARVSSTRSSWHRHDVGDRRLVECFAAVFPDLDRGEITRRQRRERRASGTRWRRVTLLAVIEEEFGVADRRPRSARARLVRSVPRYYTDRRGTAS